MLPPEGAPLMRDYDIFVQPRGHKEWTHIDTYMARVNAADSLNRLTGHSVSKFSKPMFVGLKTRERPKDAAPKASTLAPGL